MDPFRGEWPEHDEDEDESDTYERLSPTQVNIETRPRRSTKTRKPNKQKTMS